MIRMLDEHEAAIAEAVRQDLNKHRVEVVTTEIALIRDDAARAVAKLDRWAAPEYPSTRLTYALSKPHIRKEPFGMVLIMGAWNYPVSLALLPMVAAIAAGNTVVLKVSEKNG
jgi:acyl-CoA reductase-like NAD-dependent aldehyde dehydrogenase